MDHISNGSYQLLKKDPTTKIKPKTLKQLKVLKNNEFIDNKLYYNLKLTDSPAPRSHDFLYVLLFHLVAPCCTILTNT